jgi:hypothetical protein
MEFIIGMYDVDRSGDTDKMRIRGSEGAGRSSAGPLDDEGCAIRLISFNSPSW